MYEGYNVYVLQGLKDDSIIATAYLFENIVNIHPFEDRNKKICRLILAYISMRMKCSLIPAV